MIIKVLGPGCARCHQLENMTREVIRELAIDATVEYVKDIREIMKYPIMATPGLVINEEVVSSGKVPDKAKITQLITTALEKEGKETGKL